MRHILVLFLASLIFACSGGSHSSTPSPAPAPTPVATAIPQGTYTAKHTTGSVSVMTAVGAIQPLGDITQTVIVDQFGGSLMELPGWNLVNAVITSLPDGTLQVGTSPTLTTAAGATSPLTLTGTMTGNEMVGTVNGGLTFDVVLTTIQNTPIDLPTKAGTWISTSSSTGQVLRITVPAALGQSYNVTIDAYANNADAAAKVNVLGQYAGTMGWINRDTTHSLNLFDIGFLWTPSSGTLAGGGTTGLAYFDASGDFIILSSGPNNATNGWNNQLSAVFTKE